MQAVVLVARDNHGSRNRSIAIAKLITKFQGEGDPITYIKCFEQVCATFGDVSNADKIGGVWNTCRWQGRSLVSSFQA